MAVRGSGRYDWQETDNLDGMEAVEVKDVFVQPTIDGEYIQFQVLGEGKHSKYNWCITCNPDEKYNVDHIIRMLAAAAYRAEEIRHDIQEGLEEIDDETISYEDMKDIWNTES